MNYYPQNTVTQYTTKLNGQIELDGKWEVGLTEISFPFDVDNVLEGECYFVINNPGYDDSDFKITLAAGYYSTFEELSVGLRDAQVLRVTHVTSSDRVTIRFSFDEERNRVKMTVLQSLCISFSPMLACMLGFPRDIRHCLDDVLANRKMELFPPTRYMSNPPLYIPLQKKCFDTVEINLMTDTGLAVPFRNHSFGKSFVVLEFRPAAYKYFAM